MPANCEYFLLGMLFVFFLDAKTPIFTVYSTLCCMYAVYLLVSSNIKMDLHIDVSELLTVIGLLSLESFLLNKILRLRIMATFGGIGALIGFFLFLYTLRHVWSEESYISTNGPFKIVRHPLHTSLLIFLTGSCVYLASFGSLFLLFWYLRISASKLRKLDEIIRSNRNYFINTRSGIPFLTDSAQN